LEEYPVYFSDKQYESESNDNSELEFNPWNNYYSPTNSENNTEDEEMEIHSQKANSAIFLAETAEYI
jgi:hypothetical protein